MAVNRRALCIAGVVLGLALTSPRANAQSAPPPGGNAQLASSHYNVGVAEYRAGHFRAAAAEFQAAYNESHNSALLFNLGSALYDAGDLAPARDAFVRYLAETPNAPNRPLVEARVESIRQRLNATPATVVSPAETPVAPGTNSETGAATAAAATSATPPTTATTTTTTPSGPAPVEATAVPRTSVSRPLRPVGVVTAVVGVVALGVGAALWLSADATFQQCAMTPGGCDVSMQPRGLDMAGVASFWGGAAVAVVGAALALFAPAASPERAAARRRSLPCIGFDSRGIISVSGTF